MKRKAHYTLNEKELILHVKKTNIIVRTVLFVFAFFSFLMPVIGASISVISGGGFHFGFLVGIVFFGLIGFVLLRMALWNTRGREIIKFDTETVKYSADYGWFTGGEKEMKITTPLFYNIRDLGYTKGQSGSLVIEQEGENLVCVTEMKYEMLEELIKELLKLEKCMNTLPKGITGFWKLGDTDIPETDINLVNKLMEILKNDSRFWKVKFTEQQAGNNFYTICFSDKTSEHKMGINTSYPMYCGIKSLDDWGLVGFYDLPKHITELIPIQFMELRTEFLGKSLRKDHITRLNSAELEQIKYWETENIGNVIFNKYD